MFHLYEKIARSFGRRPLPPFQARSTAARRAPQRSAEAGSVLLIVTVAATTLVLFLALALDSGRLYLARTQLQSAADGAARAALAAANRGDMGTAGEARDRGVDEAKKVVDDNSVISGGASLADSDLSYGTYDFGLRQFTPSSDRTTRPSAVRVQLSRTRGSGRPIAGLFTPMSVTAEAIASLRCRQIAVVVDLSASFEEEIDKAKKGLQTMVEQLAQGTGGGDSLALITYNGAGTNNLNRTAPAFRVDMPLQAVSASSRQEFLDSIDAMKSCPRVADGSCLGTNTGIGLATARAQLEDSTPLCKGDRIVVLVTDGAPCAPKNSKVGVNTDQEAEALTAQFIDDATRQAKLTAQDGISLSTIYIYDEQPNENDPFAKCPVTGTYGDEAFAKSLAGGPTGRGFAAAADTVDQILRRTLGSVPIVVVN